MSERPNEDDEVWDPVRKIPLELRGWGTKTILRGMVEDEALWRERVGDDAYERSVEYWRRQVRTWASN